MLGLGLDQSLCLEDKVLGRSLDLLPAVGLEHSFVLDVVGESLDVVIEFWFWKWLFYYEFQAVP